MNEKSCGTCTKCCEGYLTLTINGQRVYPNNPCPLIVIGSGCSDYENRPAMPCKTYRCEWLKDKNMPDEFSPSLTNFIVHKRWIKKEQYFTLIKAGEVIQDSDIENIFQWFKNNNTNFFYFHESVAYACGSEEFLKECYNNKDFANINNMNEQLGRL